MPKMDYTELLAEMKRSGYTQKSLAEAVNITPSHFSRKLAGEYVFTQSRSRLNGFATGTGNPSPTGAKGRVCSCEASGGEGSDDSKQVVINITPFETEKGT